MMKPDILKSGAIILNDKKALLIVREKGEEHWVFVGGKVEGRESSLDTLIREVKEELGVVVTGTPQKYLESSIEKAAGNKDGLTIQIIAYFVNIRGTPKASGEIEKIHWLSGEDFKGGKYLLGSILQEHTIPRLLKEGIMM